MAQGAAKVTDTEQRERRARMRDGAEARQSEAVLRRDDFNRNIWSLLGLPVDIAAIDDAIASIDAAVRDGRRLSFVTPNVNWLVRAARDRQVRREVLNADLSLVDGAPLSVAARSLGLPLRTRVAGSDLFEALRRRPGFAGRRLKVFFFGGREGAAEAAAKAVNAEKGGVEAVGWRNPGFGDVEAMSAPEIIDAINAAAPDFVVVALGAAKGQRWIERNQTALHAPVIAHLGAVIDFTAGGIRRAPGLVRRLGLEWAWRIKEEPSLWRRYAADAAAMAGLLFSRFLPQFLFRHKNGASGAAAVDIMDAPLTTILRLKGDLSARTLSPARDA
ncbi:MAG: WecB/TagA/CpsF family glycosyltransferase, partial [Hyphococcus sp.]